MEANFSGAEYQWVNCFTRLPIVWAASQTFTPNATGNYKFLITYLGCVDSSAFITGIYVIKVEGAFQRIAKM